MTSTSTARNRVSFNLAMGPGPPSAGLALPGVIADVKVKAANAFYAPDVMVAREPADRHTY